LLATFGESINSERPMMDAEERLARLGLQLPPAPAPLAAYRPWIRTGDLLFISGQLPMENGVLTVTGKLGTELDEAAGRKAAVLCTLNGLAQVRSAVSDLNRVKQCVRLAGFVNSGPGFTGQPGVLNGASELLAEIFEDRGVHARVAVGVAELPLNAAVEIEFLFEIMPDEG